MRDCFKTIVGVGLALTAVFTLADRALAKTKTFTVSSSQVSGKPEIAAQKETGLFLWATGKTIHVRWVTGGKPVLFEGRLDLDRPLRSLKRISDVGPGWVKEHGDRIVYFSATSRGDIDGFDLETSGQRGLLEVTVDGQPAVPEIIFLGSGKVHPSGLPMSLLYR